MASLIADVRRRRLPDPKVAQAIRRASGVTQQQLADELGVHVVTVGRWETGVRAPRGALRDRYQQLLDALRAEMEGGRDA
jgi:DNA-binding transcriptional regulator YiaG